MQVKDARSLVEEAQEALRKRAVQAVQRAGPIRKRPSSLAWPGAR
jgi:hypothetical protein